MGKEATCEGRSDTRRGPVKAHLEGDRLRLTGSIRLNAPLADVRALDVRGDALRFEVGDEWFELGLGANVAAAWAKAIAHPASLLEKLGLKTGQRVCVVGLPASFARDVEQVTLEAPHPSPRGAFDVIFCAIETEGELDRIARCKKALRPAGALWVVSPKGKGSPVREQLVRGAILEAGLVDLKVVSFSATHTALKAVIPVAKRARATERSRCRA